MNIHVLKRKGALQTPKKEVMEKYLQKGVEIILERRKKEQAAKEKNNDKQ